MSIAPSLPSANMSQTKTGMKEAASTELEHVATAPDQDYSRIDVEKTETLALESDYRTSMKTYVVLILMGITWGTCTLANVGPSSTYSHAVTELGGATIESWIPNAGLFPLIGLQPFWVQRPRHLHDSVANVSCLGHVCRSFWQEVVHRGWWSLWYCRQRRRRQCYVSWSHNWWSSAKWNWILSVCECLKLSDDCGGAD